LLSAVPLKVCEFYVVCCVLCVVCCVLCVVCVVCCVCVSQDLYYNGMTRAQAGLLKPPERDPAWEMGLLEEHWIHCAKRLQQVRQSSSIPSNDTSPFFSTQPVLARIAFSVHDVFFVGCSGTSLRSSPKHKTQRNWCWTVRGRLVIGTRCETLSRVMPEQPLTHHRSSTNLHPPLSNSGATTRLNPVHTLHRHVICAFYRVYQSYVAVQDGKPGDVDALTVQASHLGLLHWHSLPPLPSPAHTPLLQAFHQLVELRESAQIIKEINGTNRHQVGPLPPILGRRVVFSSAVAVHDISLECRCHVVATCRLFPRSRTSLPRGASGCPTNGKMWACGPTS
jgi:hypothetical protein